MALHFSEGVMTTKFLCGDTYSSPTLHVGSFARLLPSASFYSRLFFGPLYWICRRAMKGLCDDNVWVYGSTMVSELLEQTGCHIKVEGMNHIETPQEGCVFVANHMSTLETFMLPSFIRPRRRVTYVIKESLVNVPMFGALMRSRDPIIVGRSNPRKDLATVIDGGVQRLSQGISIIIFPQSTRSKIFDPGHFNTIGIKLAKHANVPIIPIALKTDAWGQGSIVKDFGQINPKLPIRYRFGAPISVNGPGKEEHREICNFIATTLAEWETEKG